MIMMSDQPIFSGGICSCRSHKSIGGSGPYFKILVSFQSVAKSLLTQHGPGCGHKYPVF